MSDSENQSPAKRLANRSEDEEEEEVVEKRVKLSKQEESDDDSDDDKSGVEEEDSDSDSESEGGRGGAYDKGGFARAGVIHTIKLINFMNHAVSWFFLFLFFLSLSP